MADFNNINSLLNYAGGNTANISTNYGGKSVLELIEVEAKRLAILIQEQILLYKSKAKVSGLYTRTGDWEKSIRVGKPTTNGIIITIDITFDETMIMHPSLFTGDEPRGGVAWLLGLMIMEQLDYVALMLKGNPE